MQKGQMFIILITLSLSIILTSCGSVPAELQCDVDADCTAAVCCHASDSVNIDNAPDCSGILCSADCQEGTMDCGQAAAKCVEGACTVVSVE